MPVRILSTDETAYIRRYLNQYSADEVGGQVNISASTLRNIAKRLNIKLLRGSKKGQAPAFEGQSSFTGPNCPIQLPVPKLADLPQRQNNTDYNCFNGQLFKVSVETGAVMADDIEAYWASM